MLPALFISHGSPMLPLTESPARRFLQGLGTELDETPRAILVVSAHWQTPSPVVSATGTNETIYDFFGFPPELYALRYPAPGSAAVAARVQDLLAAAGIACAIDHARGLDHGAWVPLLLMYPGHDIPVAQLSLQTRLGPAHAYRTGQALGALRAEGVLVIGSGSFTHDLSEFALRRDAPDAQEPDWVAGFAHWFDRALAEHRLQDMLDYRSVCPGGAKNHPTEEHLLPLFTALGAGGQGVRRLHASTMHGVLRMDVYGFGAESLKQAV